MRRRFMSESRMVFDYENYMTIEALEDNVEISWSNESSFSIAPEYGIDGIGWSDYKEPIVVNCGQFVSFKNTLSSSVFRAGVFSISGKCNLRGNCLSLIFGDNSLNNNDISNHPSVFSSLFANCNIITIEKNFLPATTLANYCYDSMFYGCSSLTAAPELPATTLANYCYDSMFYGCTSLTAAPELPATTLAYYCYDSMFYGCTSLTTVPALPATELSAYCYGSMFYGCTSLNYIKMLATDISAYRCLSNWVFNVAPLGTFVKNSAMTSLPTGVSGIPEGWSVLSDDQVSEGAELITFELLVAYTAEKGMTWAEWCNSNYNIADSVGNVYRVSMNKITRNGQTYVALNGTIVNSTETIVSGAHYALMPDGNMGGGSD